MLNYLLIFIGGGLGSLCRFVCGRVLQSQDYTIPFGTLLANVLSSFLLGYLIGLSIKESISPGYQLLFMTGFCGGFSTFSTFSAEVYDLLQTGEWISAFLYLFVSLMAGLLAIFLGLKLAG